MSSLAVALTGNPNTGKSTIFNELTGARQKIGNWPGVTVDKKIGYLSHQGRNISVVDLPGTYSVNARSPEEKIVIDYLLNEKPDLVVDVLDSSNLERNLYLTIQLLEQGIPLLLDLNMQDEAKRHPGSLQQAFPRDRYGAESKEDLALCPENIEKYTDKQQKQDGLEAAEHVSHGDLRESDPDHQDRRRERVRQKIPRRKERDDMDQRHQQFGAGIQAVDQ